MTGHGYFSCLACHTSSVGGGMLTDYGKGIARATSWRKGEYQEGKLKQALRGEHGQFDHGIKARMAFIDREYDDKAFPMQFDYLASFKMDEKTLIEVTAARAPNDAKLLNDDLTAKEKGGMSRYFIRKFLVHREVNESWIVSGGRDILAYGLNLEDHTILAKSENKFGVTDFPTQLRVTYEGEKNRHLFSVFSPSFQENEGNREYGAVLKSEWDFQQYKTILGANVLAGKTDKVDRQMLGIHFKTSVKPFMLLGEIDYTRRKIKSGNDSFSQWVGFIRLAFNHSESFIPHVTYEVLDVEEPFLNERTYYGAGWSFKPTESVTIVSDYKRQKTKMRTNQLILSQIFWNLF